MTPARDRFCARWQPGTPLPIARPFPWPEDPIDLYARIRGPGAVLLESRGGPPDINRFSLLGVGELELDLPSRAPTRPGDDAGLELEAALAGLPGPRALPLEPPFEALPFTGGWVGYLSYDLGRGLERLPATLPPTGLPPARLLELPAALVCDHHRRQAALVACVTPGPDAATTWQATVEALERLEARLEQPSAPLASTPAHLEPFSLLGPLESSFSPAAYQAAVARARDYVHAGDIFQVNISQRFSAPVAGDPFTLYQRLRAVSPAPFAAYLDLGDTRVLSSSPERFLLVEPDRLETRPIKGTYRRGATSAEDDALAAALRADPKERAEHVMIVDLERNDLGRLAAPDSVRVEGLLRVERYPQVLHLVSTVEGRLDRPRSLWDIVKATFPGGSITGAPKVRAMEIIEELERTRRGIYTGAIGYVSRSGRIDLNIAIRTLVIRDGQLEMQVGGGIVADSDPVREYEETLLKAAGMRRAIAPDTHAPAARGTSR